MKCDDTQGHARWSGVKAVALTTGVEIATVWGWCRNGSCVARRLPGDRGRWRIAIGADGFPVNVARPAS